MRQLHSWMRLSAGPAENFPERIKDRALPADVRHSNYIRSQYPERQPLRLATDRMQKKPKLEVTWIGKENRLRLRPSLLKVSIGFIEGRQQRSRM